MRTLGVVFLALLIVGVIGYLRGWVSFTTTEAAGKSELQVGIEKDKLHRDTTRVTEQIGELSARTVEQIRKLTKKVSPEVSEMEGKVTALDASAGTITIVSGVETLDLVIPPRVEVVRHGQTATLAQVQVGDRARVRVEHPGSVWRVTRVEILS